MTLGLIQIWLALPGKSLHETIQASPCGASIYQIREIPFYSDEVNYMDVVRCEARGDGPRLMTETIVQSGNRTLHIMFAENMPKDKVREYVQFLRQKGITYRRSGLRAFSLNIPPAVDLQTITDNIELLRRSGALSDEDRGSVFSAQQSWIHLQYLTGKHPPPLQDGQAPDGELEA
jgi:hypothetical protein